MALPIGAIAASVTVNSVSSNDASASGWRSQRTRCTASARVRTWVAIRSAGGVSDARHNQASVRAMPRSPSTRKTRSSRVAPATGSKSRASAAMICACMRSVVRAMTAWTRPVRLPK